jgi:hypothetical protein
MSRPKDDSHRIPAARWWLAISRDVMEIEYRKMMPKHRPIVTCHRAPSFTSPLPTKRIEL